MAMRVGLKEYIEALMRATEETVVSAMCDAVMNIREAGKKFAA
jgi:hypothetical protein